MFFYIIFAFLFLSYLYCIVFCCFAIYASVYTIYSANQPKPASCYFFSSWIPSRLFAFTGHPSHLSLPRGETVTQIQHIEILRHQTSTRMDLNLPQCGPMKGHYSILRRPTPLFLNPHIPLFELDHTTSYFMKS